MIPSIETIVEDLVAGKITKSQAVTWLSAHAEYAARDLRDDFAAAALQGLVASNLYDREKDLRIANGYNPGECQSICRFWA